MAGGGMKAITWLIAIFVSLVWDTEHEDVCSGQDVLRYVTVLSTVSASSWFVMSLLYSNVFCDLLDDMGRVRNGPPEAKDIFMRRWIGPLRDLLKKRSAGVRSQRISSRHRFLLIAMNHTMGKDAANLAKALSGDISWAHLLLDAIHSNAPIVSPGVPPLPLHGLR
jgi:hypothetical protein